jgi:hypothetical protein
MDYWSSYDLLGLFLSFMGSAPNGATKRNFYLPMTAVYGRWCRQIAGSLPNNGICDLPFMFQCTWCIPSGGSGQPTQFFLGSSLAGYDWRPELTGTWKLVLRRARFDLVDGGPLRQAGYDFDNSPVIDQSAMANDTRFGNCAETYPFLDLLMYVFVFLLMPCCYEPRKLHIVDSYSNQWIGILCLFGQFGLTVKGQIVFLTRVHC